MPGCYFVIFQVPDVEGKAKHEFRGIRKSFGRAGAKARARLNQNTAVFLDRVFTAETGSKIVQHWPKTRAELTQNTVVSNIRHDRVFPKGVAVFLTRGKGRGQ
ncbi:unnamed protein product [Linum trigynum]|uniref:Uncharacterized protein n=1 Tax=Linum trigynum TaxID=586398 RepID=A0AAV2ECV7_9ROSI